MPGGISEMKKIGIVVILFALLFTGIAGGAAWMPTIPASDHSMAKAVDSYSMPMIRTYTFSTEDDQAVSWLRFVRDLKLHTMEWRWYKPNGEIYARTFSVAPPSDFVTGAWDARVWSSIQIKGCEPENIEGLWRVDIIKDWYKIHSESFTIGAQQVTCD